MRRASEAEDAAGGADQVGGGDGAVDVVLRAFDGRGDVVAEGEFRGEGSGERAAGAVGGDGVRDPREGELREGLAVEEDVGRGSARAMSALHQYGAAVGVVELVREVAGVICGPGALGIRVRNRAAAEDLRLGEVRRDERRKREEPLPDRRSRRLRNKPHATRRDHHGIDHLGDLGMRRETVRDHFDRGRVGEHAGLESADRIDAEHRVELRGDEVRRHRMDRRDGRRVLRGERGEDGAAVEAVAVERAEVGLHARIAARVGAGDGEAAGGDRRVGGSEGRRVGHGGYEA